ncbi:Bacteriophage Mu transposase [Desulforamulus putei DSM 12395]|uniref:Bacteriophage Mu transposase n=1 Tax=Desulforamulus putei DSM 12395 TaxID=1121429 RepID=A0A1M5C9J9_9FIRM|nr:transposase domain-containing protein [Desulforamulus putei]SHF51423.1 Bacteriophage Mu transposase [Desulforamulus putei DSM 12395]
MAETFVTLEEAAELEGLNYYTLYRRIQRNPGSFKTRTEERDGGKDRVLVALSSLSKKARRGYKEKVSISGSDVVVEQRTGQEAPWYVGVDLNWYLENFSKQYYQAVELGKRIQEFLNYNDGERTAFAEEFAEELGISQRTLYRYAKDYLEASAWAMRLHKENGHNYDFLKVLSLCRKPKEKFTFPSLDDKVRAYIENVWFDKDFAANDGTVEMLYMKLGQVAELQGWEYPSYQTVTRYINYLMEERRAKNAHFLAAKGMREYKNKVMVKGSRDTKSLPVLGLLQGDEHTFDCWVAFTHPNGKVTAIKPRLVGWVDTRSRVFLGDIICRHANSQILKLSLLKVIYGTPGGVPQWLLIDNGKDYNAKDLTGIKRSERKQKKELQFDEETKGFLSTCT